MDSIDSYIIDTLMRDLVGHDHKPTSFLVYLWLYAEQSRSNMAATTSYQQIAESIGVSKSSAQSAVSWLLRRKLVAVTRESITATPTYRVLTPWKRTPASQAPVQRSS